MLGMTFLSFISTSKQTPEVGFYNARLVGEEEEAKQESSPSFQLLQSRKLSNTNFKW